MDSVTAILDGLFPGLPRGIPSNDTARPILTSSARWGRSSSCSPLRQEYTDRLQRVDPQSPQPPSRSSRVKRYYRPEWGDDWREHFTVDRINGHLGHELKLDGQKLRQHYCASATIRDGSWRMFKSAARLLTRPRRSRSRTTSRHPPSSAPPRPISTPTTPIQASSWWRTARACSSSVPTTRSTAARHAGRSGHRHPGHVPVQLRAADPEQSRAIVDHVVEFDKYSEPMKQPLTRLRGTPSRRLRRLLRPSATGRRQPSKNPRYLQQRPDWRTARDLRGRGRGPARPAPAGAACPIPAGQRRAGRGGATIRPDESGNCRRSRCTARSLPGGCPSSSWSSSPA